MFLPCFTQNRIDFKVRFSNRNNNNKTPTPTGSKLGNFAVWLPSSSPNTILCFLMLIMPGGRLSTVLPNQGAQNTLTKGQWGITKKVKVHKEHNPKKTFLLGTGQADVLAVDQGLRKQVIVPSFCTGKMYYPTVLNQSCLENFMRSSFWHNLPYFPGLLPGSATSAANDHISKHWSLMQ